MKLFVLMKDGKPFELPAMIEELDMSKKFACASTDRQSVEAALQILPGLLFEEFGLEEFEIAEFADL